MDKKLIVFDWNGTLLSDTQATYEAANIVLERCYNRPPQTMAEYRNAFAFPIIHYYKNVGISVDLALENKDRANAIFQVEYDARSKNARLRRGARPLLDWLKKQNATSIILSNHIVPNIQSHVTRLKIDSYISHISANTCNGTTILTKATKAERLQAYMDQYGFAPRDTIIIGDSTEEPAIARKLELAASIGITDGVISRPRLRHAAPDHIVGSHLETKTVIEKLWL